MEPPDRETRIGVEHPVGAAHRLGLNETAKAMDIVWSRGACVILLTAVATSAAGVCGRDIFPYWAWHSLILRRRVAGQEPCRRQWTQHAPPGGTDLLAGT